MRTNFDILERKMNSQLFGQPLVKKTLLSSLKAHFDISDPRKALVLSFHGSTGVGIHILEEHSGFSLGAFRIVWLRTK